MPDWVLWVIAAGILAVGEVMASFTFIMGPIALAALVGALAAGLGASPGIQVAAFVVAAVGTLALLRPIARRHMRMPAQIRTGTDALPGPHAPVPQRVAQDTGS